jgi:hypothetical protein
MYVLNTCLFVASTLHCRYAELAVVLLVLSACDTQVRRSKLRYRTIRFSRDSKANRPQVGRSLTDPRRRDRPTTALPSVPRRLDIILRLKRAGNDPALSHAVTLEEGSMPFDLAPGRVPGFAVRLLGVPDRPLPTR